MKYKAPFPYFGGKSSVSDLVWKRFGKVSSYIEPFSGSLAVLLANPHWEDTLEVANDLDGLLVNVWRSIKMSPEEVKKHLDWPMSELDLHARSTWCESQRKEVTAKLREDPFFHSPLVAAWWIWGMCSSIGDAFIKQKKAIPSITGPRGIFGKKFDADVVFEGLSKRLINTRLTCGDWKRVVAESILFYKTPVAVFLDPPYANKDRHDTYVHESYEVAKEVEEWCLRYGSDPRVRIILAGYEGDYNLPSEWECLAWETSGGYGNISRTEQATLRGKGNASKERLWLSPSCNSDFSGTFLSDFLR
jgi:DNA adenine methylase